MAEITKQEWLGLLEKVVPSDEARRIVGIDRPLPDIGYYGSIQHDDAGFYYCPYIPMVKP